VRSLSTLYDEVWLVDFEFSAPPGERPTVVCLVAREFFSRRLIRLFDDDLVHMELPPYRIDARSLFVAYFASAEFGCHLVLDWPMPSRVLDLYVEFRNLTNGLGTVAGRGLVGALAHHGLDSIGIDEKTEMRDLAVRGGPYTGHERVALLDYCQSDVDALARLLPAMLPRIDLPRALLRGRYMSAVACMEHNGIPIDTETLESFRDSWGNIKSMLIEAIDTNYGVFDGHTFKLDRFAHYLIRNRIPWPRTATGRLALDDDTFRQQARKYPIVSPLRELRHSLSEMKLENLAVGSDGRNRCLLPPFQSRTGRNQPSNAKFIFGPSTWLRGLIKPKPGMALAYVDWSQQELAIAAALSGDAAMSEAYQSTDPYLAFAKQAGAVPQSATKQTHPQERAQFKICALAVQYGMLEVGLSQALGDTVPFARNLLRMHKETYPQFWKWSQQRVDLAMLSGYSQTVFGWRVHTATDSNPRSLANFPCQANGAEMMRLACCELTEAGVAVCCPVHDALLVEATTDTIDDVVAQTQAAMRRAGRIVLDGFELESDAKIVAWADRYMDERGAEMWSRVVELACKATSETGTPCTIFLHTVSN